MAEITRLYVRESTGGCLNGYYYDWDNEFIGRKFIILKHPTRRDKKIYIQDIEVYPHYGIVKNPNITILFKNK